MARPLAALRRAVSEDPGSPEIRRLVRLALSARGSEGPDDDLTSHPVEATFANYLEGKLAEAAQANFEHHIGFCAPCAEELVLARWSGVGDEVGTQSRFGWMRMAAAIALVLGGLLAALLAAGSIGGRIEGVVLAALRETLGDGARIDHLALKVLDGPGVEVEGLAVADPSGGPAMLAAPSGQWDLDLGALVQGRLSGSLRLAGAVINVVREPSGALNIDAILPGSGSQSDLISRARRKAVDSVDIVGGTVRLVDRSGDEPRELRMAAVDARLRNLSGTTPAELSARAGVEANRQNLKVAGEIGPWSGGQKPAYRFSEVALDAIPVRNLPGIGSVVRGGLSFHGNLASAGDRWAEISSQVSGGGELRLVSGAIRGRNLVREVLTPVLDGLPDGAAPAALVAMVAGDETTFSEISTPVSIASSRMRAEDVFGTAGGFTVAGRGSLSMSGNVEFRGEMGASEHTTRELVAIAPSLATLVSERGEISVPFAIAGTWPEVRVAVDVEKLAARTLLRDRLARLFGWLLPAFASPLG